MIFYNIGKEKVLLNDIDVNIVFLSNNQKQKKRTVYTIKRI